MNQTCQKKFKKSVDIYPQTLYIIICRQENDKRKNGIIAQLGEHLPYKQRVTGSSPVGPIFYEYHRINYIWRCSSVG